MKYAYIAELASGQRDGLVEARSKHDAEQLVKQLHPRYMGLAVWPHTDVGETSFVAWFDAMGKE